MAHPDIYLRSKVPAEIYDTLQKMAEMWKFDRIKYIRDYDLFPTPDWLLALERKYGDSISQQDLTGQV